MGLRLRKMAKIEGINQSIILGLTNDYTVSTSQIVIPAGSLSANITGITAVQDVTDENDETVLVDVASITNGTDQFSSSRIKYSIAAD